MPDKQFIDEIVKAHNEYRSRHQVGFFKAPLSKVSADGILKMILLFFFSEKIKT